MRLPQIPDTPAALDLGARVMSNFKLLCTGAGGSVLTAICCFTPLLVWLLPALGVAAWLGWIDYLLLPLLAGFLALTGVAVWRWRRS